MDPIPAPSASSNTTASSSISGVALLMMRKDQAPLHFCRSGFPSLGASDPKAIRARDRDRGPGDRLAFLERERSARRDRSTGQTGHTPRAPCFLAPFPRGCALFDRCESADRGVKFTAPQYWWLLVAHRS
jgi:hypothetical protein